MAWSEKPIDKPHTLENLADLLSQGLLGSMSRFSHFQIVEWCSQFVEHYDLSNSEEFHISPADAICLADDVIVQWELYLASQYTLDDLNRFSLNDIVLPKTFFEDWLNRFLALPTQH
ncbi:hypothetical protein [Reinekea thalattae]|uniref:Uncharacterized protein n=1 Tax=Reinekea thalattae TaxID=2593301 RepID=A0A5C8Z4J7_9GAMM|nr:hypothetical protein [Reinekea thalattae]TXR52118.1 hypothetical protein FME95_11935 [Reinekea thalattae]